MRAKRLSPKAQSIVEYVAVILVIIAVCIAAGVYYQRSLQGKYRQTGDALGGGEQYTP
jgi:Flp pilus assembly pilin Flp